MSAALAIIAQLHQRGIRPAGLAVDSRRVKPGDVFLAYPGARVDGRQFIAQALANGAVAVLAEQGEKVGAGGTAVPVIAVENLARLAGEIAHLVYGKPSEQLWLAGITGTNGKTSVSQWIAQAMNRLECKCAVIGTLGNGFPPHLDPSPNTTPDAVGFHAALADYVRHGAVACAMEVSSIGIDQGRANGAQFDVAVFTNLTRDHLEYHGTMAAYGEAKAKLFAMPGLKTAVLNLDDDFGRELAARLHGSIRTIGYSLEGRTGTDRVLQATDLRAGPRGVEFTLDGVAISAPVVGRFNASNLLAVIGALLAGDETLDDIAAVLRHIEPPPGRMQALGGEAQPLVIVDYAHTPDALEKALTALRDTATARGGKLVCVFGCGGDRDPGKRPQMGAMAERHADTVWVTSDNPRSENPQAIIDMILAGLSTSPKVEVDRAQALAAVIATADVRDVILVAGKGHEPYQEIAGVRIPYSDLEAAKSALMKLLRNKAVEQKTLSSPLRMGGRRP